MHTHLIDDVLKSIFAYSVCVYVYAHIPCTYNVRMPIRTYRKVSIVLDHIYN